MKINSEDIFLDEEKLSSIKRLRIAIHLSLSANDSKNIPEDLQLLAENLIWLISKRLNDEDDWYGPNSSKSRRFTDPVVSEI